MTTDSRISNDSKRQFSTVTKYLRKYRGYLYAGGVAVVMANALILVVPYVSKLVFDALEAGRPDSVILRYVAIAFGLAVLSGVFRFAMRRTIIWMSRYIEYDLRGEIFAHLLALSPSFYHGTRTGDLMARMTNDLEAVRQMLGPGIMYISDTIIKLTVSFAVMVYLSPRLTLYAVIPLIILPVAVNKIGNLLHRRSMRVQEKFSEVTATAQENLAGIRVVKAYRQEEPEIENFGKLSTDYIRLNMALARLQGLFIPSMRLLASASYLVVFYFGGMEIMRNELSLGDIVAFFGYLAMILWPMVAIGWVTSLYQRGKASLERINRILFTPPDVSDGDGSNYGEPMKGKIEFKNLSFGYNGHRVLENVNLTVQPGQTIGLVGMTGSGKTTLVSILARLYRVDDGRVFIDDIDINQWKLAALRRQIGFATQEPFLFSDTVAENIRFGRDVSGIDEITRTAEIAALAKDVDSFRDGYDTVVGERGITLSGGQKQRTAIARAILGRPSILIFDDVTSSVDTETEHQINERIKQVLSRRTSIIISHRVSSVKDADVILYLDEGKIAEQGSHEQLMRLNGSYAELYRSQLLEMELEQL
ncbi:MAG: ABC transporter ATP-binding protein [Candidatus Zixiibacteriota bacterium]|nr:MAG: ABC transporter ATP-binding protein [candidate division Zixibacteria bacterium]